MAANIQNDTELWQLVRQNDRAAYEVLYRRYVDLVFTEVHKRIRHQAEAEDLTQDIFLTLWEKRTNIVLEARFFSYLYRTAQNKVLNYFRDKKIPVEYLEVWETLPDEIIGIAEQPAAFNKATLAGMELLVEEERQKLPPKMRQVYELRYEHKLSPEEISEQLIISPNTVRNHLKEVRKRFSNAIRKASFFLHSLL